jgi:signal peptidase I
MGPAGVTTAPRPSTRTPGGFWHLLATYCAILILALFFITFLAQPFRIPSASMAPTLQVGDFLLGSKQAFAPAGPLDKLLPPTTIHRGDIIIFRFPPDPTRDLVKRVIGLPGDRIHLRNGVVYLNGFPLYEPYAVHNFSFPDPFRDDFPALRRTDPNVDPAWWAELHRSAIATTIANEIIVPPGKYFVLGDNRNNSEDSRYWGYVPRTSVLARPLFVYFSDAPLTFVAPASSPNPSPLTRTLSAFHRMHIIQ